MRDAGVAGPVAGEFSDEGDDVGYLKAPNFFGEMGKELKWGHHSVIGFFVAEVDAVDLLEGVGGEEPTAVLGGADAVLVIEADVPERLEFLMLPRFGISGYIWIVFIEGVIVLI